jgi:hypothetical protein
MLRNRKGMLKGLSPLKRNDGKRINPKTGKHEKKVVTKINPITGKKETKYTPY